METLKICISGLYGWGNKGDEAILLSIMDSLGRNHEYLVSTTLPFNLFQEYLRELPESVVEVRQMNDLRTDYDAYLVGGGQLNWGIGWAQALNAFAEDKPCMQYGVGYYKTAYPRKGIPKFNALYKMFLGYYDAITVRDYHSWHVLWEVGVTSHLLTMCPAINLQEEKEPVCPKDVIAACPRYEDVLRFEDNEPQINWFVQRLKDCKEEALLIPFSPSNLEGVPVDLALCREISKRLGGKIEILSNLGPREIKYVISQSKLVISGGRYHALVWAAAHNIPFEVCPEHTVTPTKIGAFLEMYQGYGSKLRDMETQNKEIFWKVMNK